MHFSHNWWKLHNEQQEEAWRLRSMKQIFIRAWVSTADGSCRDFGFEDKSDDIEIAEGDNLRECLELLDTDEVVEFGRATLIWDDIANRVEIVLLDEDDGETDVEIVAMDYERDRRGEMGLK